MANITDHVIKLQELTQKNLEILQTLNDSFFTNQNHLSVMVGGNQYAIPSFISLENKINSLAANFENLVNAPETGEAFFDFNGNSRAIQVRSYTSTPHSLVLDPVANFNVDHNDIFKDFLTPSPYINLNVQTLPNDTTQVLVKKVIPLTNELKQLFISKLSEVDGDVIISKPSIRYSYKDLYKVLDLYTQDVDYIEYDTKLDLPVRKNIGTGTYVIEEIIEDVVDENLDNYITIKFRSDVNDPTIMSSLKYRLFDETIEKMLKVGDELVTYEGNAKMQITEIRTNTNTIKVKVLHGEFLNLVPANTNNIIHISSLSKINFYSPIDFNEDKYVRVPLEEDQYVFVAVAALNSRMNVQSSWGSGLMLNTYELLNNDVAFKKYYDENVRNIGDILFEITSMMSNTLTKYTKEEYDEFTQFTPAINVENLQVIQINKHLNDSTTVKNIRSLYSQKIEAQTKLEEIQNSINTANNTLSSISFDDATGERVGLLESISQLNIEKNNVYTSLSKIMNQISIEANNSEVPIENAKYRIRGFFDTYSDDVENNPVLVKWGEHIKGIRVQYRYKNAETSQNQAFTIDDKFVFSDWNEMGSNDRVRLPKYENGSYKSILEPKNDKLNEPSFNQIDIPISQGETVDIRLKVIYDFGSPFVETSSKWSPIVNIAFPQEFLKDVKILDIIEENNNDIEANRLNNIIKEEGIPEHISDKIKDQDITYFHKPENIASGFYTAERRIIPLKDKLTELNNLVIQLQDEILGSQSEQLAVSIKQGNIETKLNSFNNNFIYTTDYLSFIQQQDKNIGGYEFDQDTGIVTTVFYISLRNDTDHIVKLYSLFPHTNEIVNLIKHTKFNINDYCLNGDTVWLNSLLSSGTPTHPTIKKYNCGGVWIETTEDNSLSSELFTYMPKYEELKSDSDIKNYFSEINEKWTLQQGNQFLYFRTINPLNFHQMYDWCWNAQATTEREGSGWKAKTIGTSSVLPDVLSAGVNVDFTIGSDVTYGQHYVSDNTIRQFIYDNSPIHYDVTYLPRTAAQSGNTAHELPLNLISIHPRINSMAGIKINESDNYYKVNPKDEILIPLVVEFKCGDPNSQIQRTMSFDILTSLYKDPINYTFTIIAKYENTDADKMIMSQQTEYNSNNTKYNVIYK